MTGRRVDARRATPPSWRCGVRRRALLGGLGVGGAVPPAVRRAPASQAGADRRRRPARRRRSPFYGAHQAGIATAGAGPAAFAAFDVSTTDARRRCSDLLREWTAAAAAMTRGAARAGRLEPQPEAPPADTGEATGLPPARLTITVGFGPSLFDDRFGLAAHGRPRCGDLPALPGDALDPDRSGGDLCIQACADDPQVAFHAIRNLARIGRGVVAMRWSQLGFGRTSATTSTPGDTTQPDGLQGRHPQHPCRRHRADCDEHVWVRPTRPTSRGCAAAATWWPAGSGCSSSPGTPTRSATRSASSAGAKDDRRAADRRHGVRRRRTSPPRPPTGSRSSTTTPTSGWPPREQRRRAILRRGYYFTDGIDPATGQARRRPVLHRVPARPAAQFVDLQSQLGKLDPLNEYIEHVGSGALRLPRRGARRPGPLGRGLFA